MKKIIKLSEQEFKNIINNVINEEEYHDIIKDPKAIALINFLNDTEQDEDYSFMDITKSFDHNYGMNLYSVGDREYMVGTDAESNYDVFEMAKTMIFDDPFQFNNDFIIQHSSLLKHKNSTNESNNEILNVLRKHENKGGDYILDKLIDDFDQYVKDGIESHGGRAALLSFGEYPNEYKSGDYFIYRIE